MLIENAKRAADNDQNKITPFQSENLVSNAERNI